MKSPAGLALALVLAGGSVAFAQHQPVDPYGVLNVEEQPAPPAQPVDSLAQPYAPPQQSYAPPPQPYVPQPNQQYYAPQPLQPYAPAPVAPQPYYGTPGYYYPPAGYAAPIYSYPPPPAVVYQPRIIRRQRVLACSACMPPQERARFFSLGLHASAFGVNQTINNKDVTMGGVGLSTRFRSRGRFAFEAAIDFLHGGFDARGRSGSASTTAAGSTPGASPTTTTGPYFHVGDVTRDSIPISLSAMVYVFPNSDAHIFNIYFLGGVGVISDSMGLTDENGLRQKKDFTEFEAHVGVGTELRFKWFAIDASVRGFAMTRDDTDGAAVFYVGTDGGPIPKNSWGYQGTLGGAFWF